MSRRLMVSCVASVLFVSGCDSLSLFRCDKNINSEVMTDDGRVKSAIMGVQCGATSKDVSWVLMSAVGRPFDDKEDRIAVFEGKIDGIEWAGPDLLVRVGSGKPVYMAVLAYRVKVNYEFKNGIPRTGTFTVPQS